MCFYIYKNCKTALRLFLGLMPGISKNDFNTLKTLVYALKQITQKAI
jgi:hypothetical protein